MPDLDSISTTSTVGSAPADPSFVTPALGNDDLGRRRWITALPMHTALIAVAAVWLLGCAWSYQEQSEFAAANGFAFPHLLPLVIDGFAVAMAGVSWAASLDARAAISARLATLLAVAGSSASNGVWAWLRTHHDSVTVALGVAVPVAANLAFEVLLGELRRQVQRRRGMPAPTAIPYPRVIRFVLAPWTTFRDWRRLVLDLTADHLATAAPMSGSGFVPMVTSQRVAEPTPRPAHIPAVVAPSTTAQSSSAAPERSRMAVTADTAVAEQTKPLPDPGFPSPQGQRPSPRNAPVETSETSVPTPAEVRRPASRVPSSTKSTRRTRELSAISIAAAAERTSRPDTRVTALAQHLATAADPDQITGEHVTDLLGIDISPRTGRRLLGQARDLLDRSRDPAASHDHQLAVVASH
jgi:hypothetical protein